MVTFSINYTGDLHCEAVHTASQSRLATDAPVDNMGRGETFSPTDLLATSLATCIMTTMAIIARKNGLELGPMSAQVEKHMSTTAPRRISRIVIALTVPVSASHPLRETLEKAAHHCPVHLSLHPEVEQALTLSWTEPQ
jgi:putative redox protein